MWPGPLEIFNAMVNDLDNKYGGTIQGRRVKSTSFEPFQTVRISRCPEFKIGWGVVQDLAREAVARGDGALRI